MKRWILLVPVAAAVLLTSTGRRMFGHAAAQSSKQDMKAAGRNTKRAARDTGRATKRTSKKAVHKSARKVHKASGKVANKTQTSP